MRKNYKTQVFKDSNAHNVYIPDVAKPMKDYADLRLAFVGTQTAMKEDIENYGLRSLEAAQKAHTRFWTFVAEECKTLQGFSLT